MKKIGNLRPEQGNLIPKTIIPGLELPSVEFDGELYKWAAWEEIENDYEYGDYDVKMAYFRSAHGNYIGVMPGNIDCEYNVYEAAEKYSLSGFGVLKEIFLV